MGLFTDATGDDNYKAVGVGSGETKDDDDQAMTGLGITSTDGIASFVVRETKPTVTLSSLSPSGSAVVGRSEVLRFNIAASSNEDVVLSKFTFKMSATDNGGDGDLDWNTCDTDNPAGPIDLSDFDLYNLTDDGTTTTLDLSATDTHNAATVAGMNGAASSPWTLLTTTGVVCTTTDDIQDVGFVHLKLPTTEIVPAGLTKTFALYFDSTGASASTDDSVRFDIPSDPITGTYLEIDSASNEATTGLAHGEANLAVADSALFAVGDVIVYDDLSVGAGVTATDERMLVTALTDGTNLAVVRGYMGTDQTATALSTTDDDIFRLPTSMLWKDDGVAGHTGSVDDFWGSYLVDSLTVSGNTLVY